MVAFDADDTLWVNEPFFVEIERDLLSLLEQYGSPDAIQQTLIAVQKENFAIMGYGAKGFILSMIETAIRLSDGTVRGGQIEQIITRGKELLRYPIQLLDGVETVLQAVAKQKKVMLITKGDLFDQESKLARSGVGSYFDYVEIVSEKDTATYERILAKYRLTPDEFLMIGNSLKSDVLPVVQIGASAVYIPYHVTAAHETVSADHDTGKYARIGTLMELLSLLGIRPDPM